MNAKTEHVPTVHNTTAGASQRCPLTLINITVGGRGEGLGERIRGKVYVMMWERERGWTGIRRDGGGVQD